MGGSGGGKNDNLFFRAKTWLGAKDASLRAAHVEPVKPRLCISLMLKPNE